MTEMLYEWIPRLIPCEALEMRFMQHALVGLVLLAPMAASLGVQVVNFRMAFFADAISHSTFTGVAVGLLLSLSPHWTTPVFGVLVGLAIVAVWRGSSLSTDTIIGVFMAGVVAFGMAVVSREQNLARNVQTFLYGDILTIGSSEVTALFVLFLVLMAFQLWGYNRLLYIGLHPVLARTHRVQVGLYQYAYSVLLAVVVVFAVRAVGVILATGLFVVPAAAARNFSRSAGAMFWWALLVSVTSAVAGLLLSAQDWARTATGATVVLVAFVWFLVSLVIQVCLPRRQK